MIAAPPNPNFGKGMAVLVVAALLLVVLMGLMRRAGGLSEAISPMPPRASDPAPRQGEAQEGKVRELLRKEGYEQRYGTTDTEIRANLGIKGKTADFVGYHPEEDRWLAAESKGGDIQQATEQMVS